ncbi:hypothetical protein EON77_20390 [bacterium]|nr:MAG: hypothetical protein EON77_20390 [bacterium]
MKPVADVAAFVLDRALGLADRRHLGADVFGRRFKGAFADQADERFDDLFRRAKDAYPIVGEKTSAYLNWRYTTCPTAKFTYFCLTERKTGRLSGFVVYTVRGNKAFVADAFTESIDETLPHLLVRFGSAARHARYDSIFVAYAGMSAFSKKIEELDFLKRDFARPFVSSAQQDLSPTQRAAVGNLQNWFLFDGELDL